MDNEEDLSDDLYDVSSGPYLRVATVANSKFFKTKDFPDSADFTLLPFSGLKPTNLWTTLKVLKPDAVNTWYDFETLLVL